LKKRLAAGWLFAGNNQQPDEKKERPVKEHRKKMKTRTLFKKYAGLFVWISVLVFLPINIHAQVTSWSLELARTLMTRFPDPNSYPWKSWSYPQGFMLEGIDKVRRYTGDKDKTYYNYLLKYANDHVDANGNFINNDFSGSSMDDMMAGAIICWAYGQTKQNNFKIAADKIRAAFNGYPTTSDGAFWHCKGCTGELWIDGVFMGEMFIIRYAQYIGDSSYCFNTATKHLLLVYKHLLKGSTNLLYHAWDEDKSAGWANKTTGLSPEVWSEGLGWYAMTLVETMEALPSNHPQRDSIGILIKNLATGLKNVQDTSGCWWDVVDKGGQTGNFTDASGSSMFVYMLQKGIELGVLDKTTYGPVVAKGYAGIIKKAKMNAQNLVDIYDACDGVGVQTSYNNYVYYTKTVNAKEATAAFLWATGIVEKPGLVVSVNENRQSRVKRFTSAGSNRCKVYDLRGNYLGSFDNEAAFSSSIKSTKNLGMYFAKGQDGNSKRIVTLNTVSR
jgi:rhamnogalacturonyl hydrolase YesR